MSLSLLFLGDSYTRGEGVPTEESWPSQLCQALETKGIPDVKYQVIAETGWTTQDLAKALEESETEPQYDMVFLSIGVNNQYQSLELTQYTSELKGLIQTALGYVDNDIRRLCILSIPDWSVTPFAKKETRSIETLKTEIDNFNKEGARLCYQQNIPYINITPLSRDARLSGALIGEDGLHPSGEMYRRWVKFFFARVFRDLKKRYLAETAKSEA